MGKFEDEIEFARQIIKDDGDNDVEWFITGSTNINNVSEGSTAYTEGEDKPWLKRSIRASESEEDNVKPHLVDIVFLPLGTSSSTFLSIGYGQNSDIPSGSIMGLMAKQSFTPKLKDYIIRNGEKLSLVMCDPISPNSDDIMYIMAFV